LYRAEAEEDGIVERKIFVVVNSETWVFRVSLMAWHRDIQAEERGAGKGLLNYNSGPLDIAFTGIECCLGCCHPSSKWECTPLLWSRGLQQDFGECKAKEGPWWPTLGCLHLFETKWSVDGEGKLPGVCPICQAITW
jgi:hypothetical protein